MSWKATAFVKDITRGISQTEKLVLMMLAEYHHTTSKASWPSVSTLAEDSLMTERGIYQVLARLQEKGFICRVSGGGRGKFSQYKISGLDTIANPEPRNTVYDSNPAQPNTDSGSVKPVNPERNPERNPEYSGNAIRKEPVLEPVLEQGEQTPPDLHPMNYATRLAQEIGLPETPQNIRTIAHAIEALARDKSFPAAYEYLLARAKDSQDAGVKVDKFYFEDRGYENVGKAAKSSASAARSERSKQNILDGFAANARRADPSLQPELKKRDGVRTDG